MDDDFSLLRAENNPEDRGNEEYLRPLTLFDFQGQPTIKENLSIFIQTSLERKESLDHVFISGPPGLGKTTLASIISNELGVEVKLTSAPALEKPKDLAGLLSTLNDRAVFFIDEIHRLRPAIEEMLYIAMEDYELDWIIGQGAAARSIRIPLPRFTLVGATTKPGRLSSPLSARFGIQLRLGYYSPEELKKIIIRSTEILNIAIHDEAALMIAQCSRGTPRVANRLLKRMRDFAQYQNSQAITTKTVEYGLAQLSIDPLGLEDMDRLILETIISKFNGGPVGVETLAISVGEEVDSLEDFYEPYLIKTGLIKRTPKGRVATELAYTHFQSRGNI